MFKKILTKRQHYIPAGYISQFSSSKKQKLRKSEIFYYDTRSNKILKNKSENIPLAEDWYFEINSSIVGIENQINLVEKKLLAEFETEFVKENPKKVFKKKKKRIK